MSLFVNKEVNPKILTFSASGSNTHQVIFQNNYLTEVLVRQEIINQHLTDSQKAIDDLLQVSISLQEKQHQSIESKLEGDFQKISEIMLNDDLLNQAILAQLAKLDDFSHTLVNKVNLLEEVSKEMAFQLNEQLNTHTQLNDKLAIQDVYHQTVMERLDQQDAISHKINFQLENLKAIIFERIGDLAEKIEVQGKLTIKYLTSLFSKSDISSKETLKEKESNIN
jgi:hypothetical protein